MTKWQINPLTGFICALLLAGSALAQGGALVAAEFGVPGRRGGCNAAGPLDAA